MDCGFDLDEFSLLSLTSRLLFCFSLPANLCFSTFLVFVATVEFGSFCGVVCSLLSLPMVVAVLVFSNFGELLTIFKFSDLSNDCFAFLFLILGFFGTS